MQAYSDPKRASEPNVRLMWHVPPNYLIALGLDSLRKAWFHGPDSDPVGPFQTEAEALADAQGDANDCEVCGAVPAESADCGMQGERYLCQLHSRTPLELP